MLGELTDYDVISVIGSGSFGTCYKVQRKKDRDIFVWKAIDYGDLSEDKKELLVTEVNLLRSIRHQNVVRYYGYIIHKESTTLYVVMELCENGDLAALVQSCRRCGTHIQEGFIWRLLYQMSTALRTLQSQGILHRDVKPANIFLDHAYNAKLGDFGLAKVVGIKSQVNHAESFVGTPGYMSPEVVKGERYDGKSDVWALGCVAYELCALRAPFAGRNMKQLARHIAAGRYVSIPTHYSNEMKRIIEFMLTVNSTSRPDIRAILHHPSVVSQLSTCLNIPPFPSNCTKQTTNLSERETLLRMRELALEAKEKQVQDRENKLKAPRPNLDLDSSAGLDESPLFRPTTARLNPALIPRPLNFPGPPRKVRFQDKISKKDEVSYKWYEIDPPNRMVKRPLSDSGQVPVKTTHIPSKPLSDSGANNDTNLRGKYTLQDLEKAVSDKFMHTAGIMKYTNGKENLEPVKHTML